MQLSVKAPMIRMRSSPTARLTGRAERVEGVLGAGRSRMGALLAGPRLALPARPPSPSRSIGLAGASTMSLVGTCGPWAWTPPSWPRQGAWRPGSGACARCPGSSQSPRTPRPGIRPLSPLDALAYFLVISALAPIDSSLPMPTTVRGFRRHFHMRHGTSFAGIHHESRRSLDISRSRA